MLQCTEVSVCEVLMKVYAPKYYQNFKCIADKCKHSCCIGLEIDIDQQTLDKYTSLSHPYANNIHNSIVIDHEPHFVLDRDMHCPHLNKDGLCNIIIHCGEGYICDICREHPRFYNFTNNGKEVGIGMSCEAACKLILESDTFDQIFEIREESGDIIKYEFDALEKRNLIFKILKDNSFQIDGKIDKISDYFNINQNNLNLFDLISSFEYLNEEDKLLFSKVKFIIWNVSLSTELTRTLAYYVYRHCSEACDLDEFISSLSFAIFCTGLISTLSNNENIFDIARIVSEEIEYSQDNMDKIKSIVY